MKRIRINPDEAAPLTGALFTGTAFRQDLVLPTESNDFNVGVVSFPRGVRNRLHTHTSDQMLIVSSGRGIVGTASESWTVSVGDIIHIPAGEKHWHGAADDSDFAHVAITRSGSRTTLVEEN